MELIDKRELIETVKKSPVWTGLDAIARINAMDTVDVVFCKDCRLCKERGTGTNTPTGYGYLYCTWRKSIVEENDYCSWGERREP